MKPKNPTIPARMRRGLTAAGLTALLAVPLSASAQDAEPARVIVTGSYLPTAESEGPLPVSVYTADTLRKLGANTPAEGLRQLPSFVGATATENDANAGNGSAYINLRALGAGNTLTLINGRRGFLIGGPGGGGTGLTDLNAVPIGAINRAEVLKDGASAIYGSDAVAGVVNLILLNGPGAEPYRGFEVDLLFGNTTNNDASVRQAFFNAGWGNDKLSLVFSANYYNREAIYSRDRFLSSQADQRSKGGLNGTSPSFPGRIDLGAAFGGQQIAIDPSALVTSRAQLRTFSLANGDGFNFRAFTPAIPEQEKFGYYGAFNYKPFADNRMQVYGSFLLAETRQDNGLAPAPFSLARGNANQATGNLGTTGDSINFSPFNAFAANQLTRVRYRLVNELNNRRSGYDTKFYRFDGGIRGDLTFKGNSFIGTLNYDTGFVYEEDKQIRTDGGDAQRSLILAQALPPGAVATAVLTRQYGGTPLLAPALALNAQFGGTFNPFIGQNAPIVGSAPTFVNGVPTGATRAYDNFAAAQRASYIANTLNFNRNMLVDGRVGGTLFPNLPQGGVAFSLGAEYRRERTKDIADPVQRQGDQLGFNAGADDRFHKNTYSFFGELSIPIVTPAMKVPFVNALEFSAALRYEHFETYGSDPDTLAPSVSKLDNGATPRFTFRYQPFDQLTIRGSYGKSFTAPTFTQLFTPVAQGFPVLFDPLLQTNTQPPNGIFAAGTPTLAPEKSDTYTLGLVYTPKWFKGFTLTLDYYQVNTTTLILNPGAVAQLFVTRNGLSGGTEFSIPDDANLFGNPLFPGVARDDTGNVDFVNARYRNSGKRFVEGLDVVAAYELPTANFGKFTWTLGWNHFFRWKAQTGAGAGTTNFRGGDYLSLPLAPGAVPNNKGYLTTDWQYGSFEFVATVNYVSNYHNDGSFLNGSVLIGGTAANPIFSLSRNSREYITLDLQASYEFKKPKPAEAGYSKDSKGVRTQVAATAVGGSFLQRMLWGTKIKAGVNNIFDTPPPYDAAAFNDNYDTSTYSIRNRYYYIGINKKF